MDAIGQRHPDAQIGATQSSYGSKGQAVDHEIRLSASKIFLNFFRYHYNGQPYKKGIRTSIGIDNENLTNGNKRFNSMVYHSHCPLEFRLTD